MATINFTYKYPYCGYGETGRFRNVYSDSRITSNGNYTYPVVFNNPVPNVSHIKINVDVDNTGSGTVLGISWDFKVYRNSYGWVKIQTFTMPEDGIYTVDCDIPNYTITQYLCVPSSRQSSSRTWGIGYDTESMVITETLEANELTTGMFQYGVFTNRSGVKKDLTEVHVNIGGSLLQATDILVNIDDTLVSLAPVNSAYLKTESEIMYLYKFIPPSDGTYKIKVKRLSGDHEIRFYDSEFTQLYDGYFYDRSFALTEGSVYYITLTHYYSNSNVGESYLQIYKEGV